jgi:hypothetical protein
VAQQYQRTKKWGVIHMAQASHDQQSKSMKQIYFMA